MILMNYRAYMECLGQPLEVDNLVKARPSTRNIVRFSINKKRQRSSQLHVATN